VVRTALSWSPDGNGAQSSGRYLVESRRSRQPPGGRLVKPSGRARPVRLFPMQRASVRCKYSVRKGTPQRVYIPQLTAFSSPYPTQSLFWLLVSYFSLSFLVVCIFLSFYRYFFSLNFFSSVFFSSLKNVRMLFLEYEMHISAMLKFLGLNCDIALYLFLHKSFYCCYSAKFLLS
jgi:hypothetical protein